jgi:hypothetical protein
MSSSTHIIPIYTTRGDIGAFLAYPYILNRVGEWIGWVTSERRVYSVHGHYVGYLDKGPRILRKTSESSAYPKRVPPKRPHAILLPASVPLAPMLPELMYGTVDVLEEAPELMPALDTGELREDMD